MDPRGQAVHRAQSREVSYCSWPDVPIHCAREEIMVRAGLAIVIVLAMVYAAKGILDAGTAVMNARLAQIAAVTR